MRYPIFSALAALILVSGCEKPEQTQVASASVAANQIGEMLYQGGLISDPQVNARMNEYVRARPRTKSGRDSAVVELHRWMQGWMEEHPDRVAAARSTGGAYLPVVNRAPDSLARSAQVDSVRKLLAEQRRTHPSQRITVTR